MSGMYVEIRALRLKRTRGWTTRSLVAAAGRDDPRAGRAGNSWTHGV